MFQAAATLQSPNAHRDPQQLVFELCPQTHVPQAFPTLVHRLLAELDGRQTLQQAASSCGISVERASAIAKKLTRLNIIRARRSRTITTPMAQFRPASTAAEPAFTPEEEAFFESEVAPIDACDEPFETVSERINLFFSDLVLRLTGNPARL